MSEIDLVHPGEILKEEFMDPLDLTAYSLAQKLHVPRNRIEQLVRGQRSITADTAHRLSRYFGNTAQFWMNLQSTYDINSELPAIEEALAEIEPHQERKIA